MGLSHLSNIGTDPKIKVMRLSDTLEMGAMVGIDLASDGLARPARMGVATTHEGIDGLLRMPEWREIEIVFDAASVGAHQRNSDLLLAAGKWMVADPDSNRPVPTRTILWRAAHVWLSGRRRVWERTLPECSHKPVPM